MNAFDKVCHFYGQRIGVVEVREWAHVYWVRFSGKRPTMLSKRLVDRAAFIESMELASSDKVVRDNKTGDVYALRRPCYGVSTWAIKRLNKGQTVNQWSDFAELRGQVFEVAYPHGKVSCLRELLVKVA